MNPAREGEGYEMDHGRTAKVAEEKSAVVRARASVVWEGVESREETRARAVKESGMRRRGRRDEDSQTIAHSRH